MRKHNGMRPQDIVVLLKILCKGDQSWMNKDLAYELFLSQSEISESLNRNKIAGLISTDGKKVHRQSLFEFIQYGLHYVFPVVPEGPSNGIATAHSHPVMQDQFTGNQVFVWPDMEGKDFGSRIEPLYKDVVRAVKIDNKLYTLLALIDVLRVGRVREVNYSLPILKQIILHE